eukprot:c15343_g1_i1.p1 GENE.c15343_g1_i1~~c15343_g1_i1.p1  ORF type:complete len:259 (-),score=21.68 c15343_g1_i1:384-1160(-)
MFRPRVRPCARSWGVACDCGDLCACENCCSHPKVRIPIVSAKSECAKFKPPRSADSQLVGQPSAFSVTSIEIKDLVNSSCCCSSIEKNTETSAAKATLRSAMEEHSSPGLPNTPSSEITQDSQEPTSVQTTSRRSSRRVRAAVHRSVPAPRPRSRWAGSDEDSDEDEDDDSQHESDEDEPEPKRRQMSRSSATKAHQCEYQGCSAVFTYAGDLTRHLLTHTGVKPFACEHQGCNKSFTRRWSMQRHMRDAHSVPIGSS